MEGGGGASRLQLVVGRDVFIGCAAGGVQTHSPSRYVQWEAGSLVPPRQGEDPLATWASAMQLQPRNSFCILRVPLDPHHFLGPQAIQTWPSLLSPTPSLWRYIGLL